MQPIGETSAPRKARTARTIGAIGLGVVTVIGGAWLLRLPLAQSAGEAFLRANGLDGQLRVQALGPTGITLEDVRLGPASAPDLRLDRLRIGVGWTGLLPKLERIEAIKPKLHGRWKEDHFSFGGLDRFLTPAQKKPSPFSMPAIALEILDGQIQLDSPLGTASATASSKGILGRDFVADGQWRFGGKANSLSGPLSVRAQASGLAAMLRGSAPQFASAGISATDLRIEASVNSDLSFSVISGHADVFADAIRAHGGAWENLLLRLEGGLNGNARGPLRWRARASLGGGHWNAPGFSGDRLSAKLALDGTEASAGGRFDAGLQHLTGPGFSATEASFSGPIAAQSLSPLQARIEPSIRIGPIAADRQTRSSLRAHLTAFENGPLHDFVTHAVKGVDGALIRASFRADPRITLNQQGWEANFSEPMGLFAANGAFVRARLDPEGAALGKDGAMRAAGAIEIGGPNLPNLKITQAKLARSAAGTFQIAAIARGKWQAGSSRLALDVPAFSAELAADGSGGARSTGRFEADLDGGGVKLSGLKVPLDGTMSWRDGALRTALAEPFCASLSASRLEASGARLDRPAIPICAPDGMLFSTHDGQAAGGFRLGPLAWRGALDGKPITVETNAIVGQWSGSAAAPRLRIALTRAELRQMGGMQAALGRNRVDLQFGAQFGAVGRFEDGAFAQAEIPSQLSGLSFTWSLSPKGEVSVRDGGGLLRAMGGEIPVHQPIRLNALELTQIGSRITGSGRVALDSPALELGLFSLRHDLGSGKGDGDWQTRPLTFSSALQPFQISETLRGVIELARGAIAGSAHANWDAKGFGKVGAMVELQKLSFSTLALGPIDGVNGRIVFDDLLAATTPESQRVTVDQINPGLPVANGTFIFQLEPQGMLRLQSATWPYAKGILSIDPTRVKLGGDITTFNLRLSKVDLPALLDQLSLSESVRATGTVEGEFPLVFTPAGGRIENGNLAAIGAGLIAMQNPALDQTVAQSANTGQAGSVGFLQALQGFSYDELALRNVNGAIDGEISADIVFAGENVAPISLPIPGGKNLVGLPYRFRVTVRAPLLQLSRSAQSTLDYKSSIAQALELEKQATPAPDAAKPPFPPKSPVAPR